MLQPGMMGAVKAYCIQYMYIQYACCVVCIYCSIQPWQILVMHFLWPYIRDSRKSIEDFKRKDVSRFHTFFYLVLIHICRAIRYRAVLCISMLSLTARVKVPSFRDSAESKSQLSLTGRSPKSPLSRTS